MKYGFSKERIRQIHLKVLKILRNNKTLQEIYGGYKRHYNWNAVQSLQNRPNTSSYVTDSTKKGYTDLVHPVIFLWEIFSCRCIKIDLRTQEIMLLWFFRVAPAHAWKISLFRMNLVSCYFYILSLGGSVLLLPFLCIPFVSYVSHMCPKVMGNIKVTQYRDIKNWFLHHIEKTLYLSLLNTI